MPIDVPQPIHLRPHADVAERALLPGDPGRALRLAQQLTEGPRMLNHNRGLWGYTGVAADARPLTIQSTGMGGPSAAIVVEELIMLGARRLVRIGTCGALDFEARLGELVVADPVLAYDGTSRALGAGERVAPDGTLAAALAAAAGPRGRRGPVVTTDLFYDPDFERREAWLAQGAVAVEMEAASVLTVAARRGAAAACVLAVTDLLGCGERRRIGDEGLAAAEGELGRVGLAALG